MSRLRKAMRFIRGLESSKTRTCGSNEYPYAAYVLKYPLYDNEFTERLNVSFHTVPFEIDDDKSKGLMYRMETRLRSKWQRLEDAILFTMYCIRKYYDCFYNLGFRECRLPSSYGFHRSYADLKHLRRSVMNARDAFGLLFAQLSFLMNRSCTSTIDSKFYKKQGGSGRTSDTDESSIAGYPPWARARHSALWRAPDMDRLPSIFGIGRLHKATRWRLHQDRGMLLPPLHIHDAGPCCPCGIHVATRQSIVWEESTLGALQRASRARPTARNGGARS